MKTDLVLEPFGVPVGDLVAAARAADGGGFDTVWTYDHFSGLVKAAPWARDPFVTLTAIAVATQRINVGVLVANVANRHPAQLACAVNSLQSLAPGRVMLGVGAGASASSVWSAETAAISRPVPPAPTRRALLAEQIDAVRAIWSGESFIGEHFRVARSSAVTDGAPTPPIIVGASSRDTIRVACEHADGVNIQPGADLSGQVAFARAQAVLSPFEVSVFAALDVGHPLAGDPAPLTDLGVERRTLYLGAPYPLGAIGTIAAKLREWNAANG
jgi:alkanesulfonate monooxygenase SsuD/methylene tetrahydromethanopterin reductase-like flavin-dependent oxidoreductase (luciferase family)